MQKTSNYNLKKPEPNDPLRVVDFNENADLIDAALGAAGNCRIATGYYIGEGKWGEANPITLTMDFSPQWVMIAECGTNTTTSPRAVNTCVLVRPLVGGTSTNGTLLRTAWGDNSVSWHCSDDAEKGNVSQNNYPNYIYRWVALSAAA